MLDVVDKDYAEELSKELNSKRTPEQIKAINNSFLKLRENYKSILEELDELKCFGKVINDYILNNEDYFTWDVGKKYEETEGKNSPATSSMIKKQIGTFEAVANPYTSTILKMISLIRFAKTQALIKGTIKKLQENGFTIKEAQKKYNGAHWEYLEPDYKSDLGLITVMEEGKVKGYYVEKKIAQALDNKTVEIDAATKLLSMLNKPVKASLTGYNPIFLFVKNPIRDAAKTFLEAPMIHKHFGDWSAKMVKEYLRALPGLHSLMSNEEYKKTINEMKREGILTGDRQHVLDPDLIKNEEELIKSFYEPQHDWSGIAKAIDKFTGFFRLLNYIEDAGKRIERAPKVAAYEYYQKYKDEFGLEQSDINYFTRVFAGSPDFRRKGSSYFTYNTWLLYSNAFKEGYRSMAEAATYSPREFTIKAIGLAIVPALMTLLGEANDPDWWEKVSEYDKTNYYVIPYGYDENKKPVYFRMPMDESVRLFASAFRKLYNIKKNDPLEALSDVVSVGADQLPSSGPAVQSLGILSQYLAGQNPYDMFRGQNIFNDRQWALRKRDRPATWGILFKHIWNNMGGGTWYKFNPQTDITNQSDIEKLAKMSVFGMNMLGSFLKVGSDKPKDENKQKQFEINEQAAYELNLVDQALAKKYEDRTVEERQAIHKHFNYFQQKQREKNNKNAMDNKKDIKLQKAYNNLQKNKNI